MAHILVLYLGSLILRSIGIALIAGIFAWKIRNVAIRHAVWVGVLGAMLLVPAVDYILPAAWVPARIQRMAAEQPAAFRNVSVKAAAATLTPPPARSTPSQPKPVDWWQVAAMLYVVVAGAMFVRLAGAYRKLSKLRRDCKAVSCSIWEEIRASHRAWWRIPVLMESESAHVPMTIGFVKPAVILPVDWRTWDAVKLQIVLLHETAHIRRGDWGIVLVAAVAKCAYWSNPLSWFLERKLSLLAEQACDDATLSAAQDATYYAEILFEFAAASQNGGRLMKGGVAMAHQRIQERIERVLGMPHLGTGIVRIAVWIVVVITAAPVIYSASAVQVKSEPVEVSAAIYTAEFGRNPVHQAPATVPQTAPAPAPPAALQARQNVTSPATDLQELFQLEVESLGTQRQYEELKLKLNEAQLAGAQARSGQVQNPQIETRINGSVEFLQSELEKLDERLNMLQAEVEIRKNAIVQIETQTVDQPRPTQDQLDRLIANIEALDSYRVEIPRLNRQMEEKRLASASLEKRESRSGNRVFVTGKVRKPGDFETDGSLTVLQALASAGGFEDYAKPDAISIIRMTGETSTLFHFNYSEVIKGVNASQNIFLSDGDVVVVP